MKKETKHHFIALVPMGGNNNGRIAQHSTNQKDIYEATDWARNRFSHPFTVVDMRDHNNDLSLDLDTAERIYKESDKVTP